MVSLWSKCPSYAGNSVRCFVIYATLGAGLPYESHIMDPRAASCVGDWKSVLLLINSLDRHLDSRLCEETAPELQTRVLCWREVELANDRGQ